MKQHQRDEHLILTKKVYITKECYDLIDKERKKYVEKFGGRVSRAKIVCNLILKHL